jgi:hypothetical protein
VVKGMIQCCHNDIPAMDIIIMLFDYTQVNV